MTALACFLRSSRVLHPNRPYNSVSTTVLHCDMHRAYDIHHNFGRSPTVETFTPQFYNSNTGKNKQRVNVTDIYPHISVVNVISCSAALRSVNIKS